MKYLFKALLYTATVLSYISAGTVHVDPLCSPQKIRIYIDDEHGKTLIDRTLNDPQDKMPIYIRLDSSKKYHFKIETFPPKVHCFFKGAKGDTLPADPDIVCNCLQLVDGNETQTSKINIVPGRWKLTTHSNMRGLPTPTVIECVKNPIVDFGIERLADINAGTEYPIVKRKQTYEYAEWIRAGLERGRVDYMGKKIKIRHNYNYGGRWIIIKGEWIGDCQ